MRYWGEGMRKRHLLLLLIIGLFFGWAVSRLEQDRQAEGKQQLETALRRTAVSCYAAEGFYPPDVTYLQEHYGLQFDEKSYVVHYERKASNWMPEITVLERSP